MERERKIVELAVKIDENKDDIKLWFSRAKLFIAVSFVIVVGIYYGSVDPDKKNKLFEDDLVEEFFSLKNLIATIKEVWLLLVFFPAYLLLKRYNDIKD